MFEQVTYDIPVTTIRKFIIKKQQELIKLLTELPREASGRVKTLNDELDRINVLVDCEEFTNIYIKFTIADLVYLGYKKEEPVISKKDPR